MARVQVYEGRLQFYDKDKQRSETRGSCFVYLSFAELTTLCAELERGVLENAKQ